MKNDLQSPSWILFLVALLASQPPVFAGGEQGAPRVTDATLKAWRKGGLEIQWLDQGRAPDHRPGKWATSESPAGALLIPLFDFPENYPLAKVAFPVPEGPFGIRLTSIQLADPAFRPIRAMKTLTTILLKRGGKLTRQTLAALKEIDGLVDLAISDLEPDQALLADLHTLPRLRALSVWTPVKDETIAAWSKLQHLTGLDLTEGRGFTGTGLKALAKLHHLSLHQSNVADEGLLALGALKDLRTLNLSFAYRATDKGLAGLTHLTHLTEVNLYDTSFGDAGLKHLPKQITSLNLRNARGVTDAGLKEVARLSGLEFLNLSQTRVTDVGLRQLTGLSRLRRLNVRSTGVTPAGLAAFQKAVPECQVERN